MELKKINLSNLFFWVLFFMLTLFLIPWEAFAASTREPEVKIYNSGDLSLEKSYLAFDQNFQGGGSVAVADLGGDGVNEIIVGAGPGGGPHVKIFRTDGSLINNFFAYQESFSGGVKVAAGDLDNDGQAEIVTGTGKSGGPFVRVFDGLGNPKLTPGFFAYDENFRGGVNVAVGDVNGDGYGEIVTGAGPGGGPHVRVFSRSGNYIGYDFFPFDLSERGGVSVAVANVDGGNESEIVMGVQRFGKAWVKVYKANQAKTILGEFLAFPESFKGGINLAGGDVDNDGFDEVITAANTGGGPHLRSFEAYGLPTGKDLFAYESDFRGGVNVASGNLTGNGNVEIITAPNRLVAEGRTDLHKYIEVDLSEQKLYAYENGYLVDSFLISSGLSGFPTPQGTFDVFRKRGLVRMSWYYGPGNPNNYDLPNVPHVLSFLGPYTIHGTYWHNDFGNQRSHGCVNVPLAQAAWLYDWAPMGTIVIVHG